MKSSRSGLVYGFLAYLTWGFFPLYWPLLEPAGPVEVLAHRIVWSVLAVGALILVLRRWQRLKVVAANRRRMGFIAVGAVTIALNWGMYIYGVNSGQVVEASLGYFINPLITILLGVLVMGERLRAGQWAGLAIALGAVVQLSVEAGRLPWIALTLAFSFGTYGLMKKKADVGSTEGLALETAILSPLALVYLVWLSAAGGGAFGHFGWGHALLLVGTGVVTAVPLLLFGAAAVRISMTTMGVMQYLVPILQFAIGVFLYHEQMSSSRWIGFGLVWLALVVITAESLAHRRRVAQVAPEMVS
ncbi:EamA family transporter RarD [Actinokineospora pegani]|uniref:EamA family transporter RarD n=1 Tax=Actinokineospora pegani TaxID=2654637 RepID=UPI0012EABBC6|nr:EamA family transporter RarD [Actinokineospora pegani]